MHKTDMVQMKKEIKNEGKHVLQNELQVLLNFILFDKQCEQTKYCVSCLMDVV